MLPSLISSTSRLHPPLIAPLPLHDALPISQQRPADENGQDEYRGVSAVVQNARQEHVFGFSRAGSEDCGDRKDRKSTSLNSSHVSISYAVFCLKKKNKEKITTACQHMTARR